MNYELRLFDRPLLRFSADKDLSDPGYVVTWIDDAARELLPHGMDPTARGLGRWVERRSIPKNRAFANNLLARSGLSANRPLGIIAACKGLSLNDSYWVCEEGSEESFAKVNLYQNRMSKLLGGIAFTGHGSSPRTGFSSSPEFTTNGMLPKCWRRMSGTIHLYKGGTTGAVNAGFEPYSEYYAADIAHSFGANAVDYELHKFKGILCSSCELFTDIDHSYVPMANVVTSGGFGAVVDFCKGMGEECYQSLSDMLAFDAIVCNTDRHYNNFGFIADSHTNELLSFAPLFDHGNSLFHQAYGDDWASDESLSAYASAFTPRVYDDFFATAKAYMTHETRAKVRRMLAFEFSRGPRLDVKQPRLRKIERQVRMRAKHLIEA